ncbi:hypothetical protein GCM10010425_24990 [Streptomyces spororaveus]|uniref:Uncharacterized protein n=1 Tax=Streptomyces spororaveus TaxID=284039 RepID=A0ABQ3TGM8_9ACTN|nr:hypothetical protein [Streptomyces spororaveus]MCM9080118.1 hypothetical protein [Streptomyces spororaveus]GHI79564.1 hypothetical protein Sspor_51250 [Streptomyces spororaveus]
MTNRAADGVDRDSENQWAALPEGIRRQADGYVLQDRYMQAVRLVWDAGRAGDVGLKQAQLIVSMRYEHHGDRVARTPDCPIDFDSLAALAHGIPGRVVAIEAVWDGDTVHDWFVNLLALTEEPVGQKCLATIYWGTAVRALGDADTGGLHPSATAATHAGTALAEHLGVPFHFASPDTPDEEAPRWRS